MTRLWIDLLLIVSAGQDPSDAPPPLPLSRLNWPGVVLIVIVALFLAAAIVGPLVRANTRDDLD